MDSRLKHITRVINPKSKIQNQERAASFLLLSNQPPCAPGTWASGGGLIVRLVWSRGCSCCRDGGARPLLARFFGPAGGCDPAGAALSPPGGQQPRGTLPRRVPQRAGRRPI